MKKSFLKISILLILLLMMAGFFTLRTKIEKFRRDLNKEKIPAAVEFKTESQPPKTKIVNLASEIEEKITEKTEPPTTEKQPPLKTSFNLGVPFTPQAPTGNWELPFKEACEEASLLMVDYFYRGKTLTAETAEREILKIIGWLEQNLQGKVDLTIKETAWLAKHYFNYPKSEILENPTIEQIKRRLDQKHPVILPAAGQMLNNPYFTPPGPVYHMLVIKGYLKDKFITNDPGTRRGHDYLYNFETVMAAMHDWHEEDIRQGAKRVLVIYPN